MRISKDRDAYWQYRLDSETRMRQMWEESMAQVAKEQEVLEARVEEAEEKKKAAKRILKEVMRTDMLDERPGSVFTSAPETMETSQISDADGAAAQKSPSLSMSRRQTVIDQVADLSEEESDNEEFFDAVDAGQVEVEEMLPPEQAEETTKEVVVSGVDISSAFKGYENGIRHKLKIDADNRPKISLWVSPLKIAVQPTFTDIGLGNSEIHDWQGHDQDDTPRHIQRAHFVALPVW